MLLVCSESINLQGKQGTDVRLSIKNRQSFNTLIVVTSVSHDLLETSDKNYISYKGLKLSACQMQSILKIQISIRWTNGFLKVFFTNLGYCLESKSCINYFVPVYSLQKFFFFFQVVPVPEFVGSELKCLKLRYFSLPEMPSAFSTQTKQQDPAMPPSFQGCF